MGYVYDAGNLNPTALTTPGAYIQLDNPTGGVNLAPSSAIAQVGSASYGPVNQATGPFGDTGSAASVFGQFSAAAFLADPYDLMRGVMQAIGEAQTDVSILDWLVRITDGTDSAATVTLMDVTPTTPLVGGHFPAKFTGSGGNSHKIIISNGAGTSNFNVTFVSTYSGAVQAETFLNIPGNTSGADSPFWTNLATAMAVGNASRGPSQLMGTPTSVSVVAENPALGTFSLSGGTDGRSGLTSSNFFGSDTVGNRQGVYALRGLPIVPAFFECCGLTDNTKFANLQQLTYQEIMRAVLPLPAGTTTSAAVTARNTAGISDKRVAYAKDWIYWSDPISGQTLFTNPVSVMIGRMGSMSPELSPLNTPVLTVIGTEHPQIYPGDEIGLLETNGILVLANPCLGSPYFGFITGNSTSLNPISAPIEYSRLQDWIGLGFAATLGQWVGKKQGIYDPDKTRAGAKAQVDNTMYVMYQGELIVDWKTTIDTTNNTPVSIQQGYLNGKLQYVPFDAIKFVVLEIATTSSLSPGQALAAAFALSGAQNS